MIAAGVDPISQFEIKKLAELKIGNFDISFTNSALMMVVTIALIALWLLLSTSKKSLIPGRAQSIAEISYEFIADMLRSAAGKDGMKFFPFVFALFIFILFANLLGMIPFFFTTTSHIIVTLTLALMVFFIVTFYGIWKNGFGFLKLFWPSGVPIVIKPFVCILELISYISRPISHSIRLWANVMAGHIMLKVFAGFCIMLVGAFGVVGGSLAGILPFLMTFALTPLELLVSFVQAYVFALLTCIYLSDAVHPGH